MARIQIVPDDQFSRMVTSLGDGGNVVLIPQSLANRENLDNRLRKVDMSHYDCGGEADVWVDLVDTPQHYFMRLLKDRESEHQG